MSDVSWFFRCPRSAPGRDETFSQLYLLRRDIDTCFGTDPNTGAIYEPVDKKTGACLNCQAIWPGTMAIMAGIDLLGKFLSGTDKAHGPGSVSVGKRFKRFIMRYLDEAITNDQVDLVYQLRNSLLHSFGLYSEKTDNQGNVTATYYFLLTRGAGTIIQHIKDNYYLADVQRLRELFERAVSRYEAELSDTSRQDYTEIKDNFDRMFPKHAKAISVFTIKET